MKSAEVAFALSFVPSINISQAILKTGQYASYESWRRCGVGKSFGVTVDIVLELGAYKVVDFHF